MTPGDVHDDVLEVSISWGDQISTEYVVSLGGNRYRLDATPLLVDLEEPVWLGDIVDLEPLDNGVLLFRGMVSKSPWRHSDWVLSPQASAVKAFKHALETAGGKWEQVLGGLFIIHLPPDSAFDPDLEWEDCLRRFPGEEASNEPVNTPDSRKVHITIDLTRSS